MTPRNLEKKISLLRRTMNLSDEDVRLIVSKQPAILHYSAERNLGSTIIFLVRALDLSKNELRTLIVDSPSILGYALGNLSKKLDFFVNTLGYADNNYFEGMERVRNLLITTPKLLLAAVDTGLLPRFQFLHNEIEFSLTELQTLYEKNPKLLLYSVDENLREKIVFFFILRLHIEPESVRRLMLAFPQVMDYNLENHMKPIADYYISDLRFSATEFGSIVTRFPRLFSYSLYKIKHVTGFLRFELGLNGDGVKRVIFQAPQIVGLNTEGNLQKKLSLLQTRLSLTNMELGLVLSKMPTLMNLGIEANLLPKLEYLEKVSGDSNSNDTVKSMVLKQPTLLGYSLEKRIRTRMEKIISSGMPPDKITIGISMTEEKFRCWLSSSKLRVHREVNVNENSGRSKISYLEQHLSLNQTEVELLLSRVPSLKYVRANKAFERKVSHFKADLKNSTKATKAVLIERPHFLQCSIKQGWLRRMQQIQTEGIVNPHDVVPLLVLSKEDFRNWILRKKYPETVNFLNMSSMKFSQDELDSLLLQVSVIPISDTQIKEAAKFLHSLSGGNFEDIRAIAFDSPKLLSSEILLERWSARKATTYNANQFWDFDPIATLLMSENDFEQQLSKSNAKMVLHKKLNFTRRELDFVVSQQVRKNFHVELASKIDLLVIRDFGVGLDIAILSRPQLLSQPTEKLQKIRRVVLSTSNKAKLLYEEETMELLSDFGFTEVDANNIICCSKILGLRHPRILLQPKLDLLSTILEKDVILPLALEVPLLFDKTLAELELLVTHDALTPISKNQLTELQRKMDFTALEFKQIFPSEKINKNIISTWQYLSSRVDSLEDLKAACLSKPSILSLSLSKRIKPRMAMLLEEGCKPNDILSVACLSKREADEFCLQSYFYREFGLGQTQAEQLSREVLTGRTSPRSLRQTLHYLLMNAFGGSRKRLKIAMLENPCILKQSLDQIIKPRLRIFQVLESSGFSLFDYCHLLSMSNSKFNKKMLEETNWNPEQTDGKISPTEFADPCASAVREMMQKSLVISRYDQDNRDLASVVQWR